MESFKNMAAWSDAMLKRGYTSGQDSRGGYYEDKLGFKHRYKEGGILGRTSDSNSRDPLSGDDSNLSNEWLQHQGNSDLDYNNPNNYTGDTGSDNKSDTDKYGETGINVTDRSRALGDLSQITQPHLSKIGLNELLGKGLDPQSPDSLFENDDDEEDTKLCICQTGLTMEKFKKYFNIDKDYIFADPYMEGYKETYKTPIDKFLAEFVKLFEKPFYINNCYRKAHFLAQSWAETGERFGSLEEKGGEKPYDPYRGRGGLHMTHSGNYRRYSEYIGDMRMWWEDYTRPAAKLYTAVHSAGWYWILGVQLKDGSYVDLNKKADERQTDRISRYINGGYNKIIERRNMTNKLLKYFNAKNCINMKNHP